MMAYRLKRSQRALLCAAAAVATGSCSPPNRSFEPVSFPSFTSMTCEVKAISHGVLNPTFYRDQSNDPLTLVLKELELEAGTATLVGNNGTEQVEFRATDQQLQFMETTMMGNLTLTTVFAPPEAGQPMPAVHSRHIWVAPANVSISQFAGECVPD